MILPENGKIIVIDDQWDEVKGLISVLSKAGHSVIYYDGSDDAFPNKPIDNVRVLFLDIELINMPTDKKSKISKIRSDLKTLIGENTYPYTIIAWTKEEDLFDELKKSFTTENNHSPVFWLKMNKLECRKKNFDLVFIKSKLIEELEKNSFINLTTMWENVIHRATGKTVHEICKNLYHYDENWNSNMLKVFANMSKASAGKQIDLNNPKIDEIIKNGYKTINTMLTDSIEEELLLNDFSSHDANFTNDIKITDDVLAKVNRKLLTSSEGMSNIEPGSVIGYSDDNILKRIINDSLNYSCNSELTIHFCKENNIDYRNINEDICKTRKKDYDRFSKDIRAKILSESVGIKIEITPRCDYAQKKYANNKFVVGLLLSIKYKTFLNNSGYNYKSPIIEHEDKQYIILLDYRYLLSDLKKNHENEISIFKLRRTITTDIQNEFSNYMSRVGVTNL